MSKTDSSESEENDWKYSKHFVAFLDVLGFKEMICKADEINRTRIRSYYQVSDSLKRTWNEKKKEIKFASFSDSIVIACAFGDEPIETFRLLLDSIRRLQFSLARNNVWVRGGVSCGDLYWNDASNVIFGPALVRAYDLETTLAKYPRVIVDTSLLDDLGLNSCGQLVESINQGKIGPLFKWNEGRCEFGVFRRDYPMFVNYLFIGEEEVSIMNDTIVPNLIRRSRETPHAYEKFRWVADYLLVGSGFSVSETTGKLLHQL